MIILNKIEKLNCDTVITLGNFDGLHVGHRKLIEETKVLAKKMDAKSLVFSFFPHTNQILQNTNFKTIFTRDEKKIILKNLYVDYFLEFPFNKNFAKIKSQDFLNLLIENLNCKLLILGEDCKFGSDKFNYNNKFIKRISNINFFDKKISSTYIRKLIQEKKFALAETLLGGKYFIMQKRFGTKPNLFYENKLLPPDGNYQTKTLVGNRKFDSITHIDSFNKLFETKLQLPDKIFLKTVLICF